MTLVTDLDPGALAGTASFQLGALGALVTERFTAKIAQLGLKPKHAGALQGLLLYPGISQQELAQKMGVAPSLMVGLLDHLEDSGAIERERDHADRRRQVIVVTPAGERLFTLCAKAAAAVEADVLATLGKRADDFRALLAKVARDFGVPTDAKG